VRPLDYDSPLILTALLFVCFWREHPRGAAEGFCGRMGLARAMKKSVKGVVQVEVERATSHLPARRAANLENHGSPMALRITGGEARP
jgi:hypothetical protein